jgi:L-aminopeptidase/D-esterase-like protein
MNWFLLTTMLSVAVAMTAEGQRARDLGVPFDGTPGPLNAITDVAGVTVGQVTLIRGAGKRVQGVGPVRTGVTAIFPRGNHEPDPVFASWFTLNGNGEMTGTTWLEESGYLKGPVLITNTNSVGIVRDAVIEWSVAHVPAADWELPIVAETWDGALNDIDGFHVTKQDAFAAIEAARGGPVTEGVVGGGTGMVCHEFKGGIGTSSRRVKLKSGATYTIGVLVQCNYGIRQLLTVAGVPVGKAIPDLLPCFAGHGVNPPAEARRGCDKPGVPRDADAGSIIVVVATDAPLLPHELHRIAKRVALGVGRTGGFGGDGSGDIFVAFSTANPHAADTAGLAHLTMLPNEQLDRLFEGTIEATHEAIVNALVAATTTVGADSLKVTALPHDRLRAALIKYNRLASQNPSP